MALTDCFVEPVIVELDGEPYEVTPFTVADIAYFQRYIESQDKHPFESRLEEYFASETLEQRRTLLRECIEASKSWGPMFGSRRSEEILLQPLGRAVMLKRMLSKHKVVPDQKIIDLALRSIIDDDIKRQYVELLSVLNERSPQQRMEGAVESLVLEYHGESGDDGDSSDYREFQKVWSERIARLCETYHWTLDYVGSLTLRQFRCAEFSGSVDDETTIKGDRSQVLATAKRRREALGI